MSKPMNSWGGDKADKERDGEHREKYLCAVCSPDSPARLHRHSAKVWVRTFTWKVWFHHVEVFVLKALGYESGVAAVSYSKKCWSLSFSSCTISGCMCLSRCWSYLGSRGGRQTVSLQSPDCLQVGVISHEFMHALGFVHEQSRFDRDNYVTIMWPNIWRGNFKGAGRKRGAGGIWEKMVN